MHRNYVYFFNGWRDLLRFDLAAEKWDIAGTENKGGNYQDSLLLYPCVELLGDEMYVYGGSQGENVTLNTLMVLDLVQLRWRELAINTKSPPPREAAGSWIVPEQRKLYVMFGNAIDDYAYEDMGPLARVYHNDMWSYSIDKDCWEQESIRGNCPTSREHMAAVYHPGLKSAIVYGGISTVPTVHVENDFTMRTYYADAFVFDVDSRRWRQIVTRNFPTWRLRGSLLVDHTTGYTYLFGGTLYLCILIHPSE